MTTLAQQHREFRDVADSALTLYESDRTRITRINRPDRSETVIVKEFFGQEAHTRLQNEREILGRLVGVEGMPQLSNALPLSSALIMNDLNAVPLPEVVGVGPMDVGELVRLAPALARLVATLHRYGVIHKDLTPANIVLTGPQSAPALIDFDLATTFAQERPVFTHQSMVTGTLAYLAPEQTGRTGRPVDERSDLYGLGATLYRLATGRPPVDEGNPLQMIHDHLARVPVAPSERNPAVPQLLSDVIMRLLEKEPDQRYQSAQGAAGDLTRLSADWSPGGQPAFELARNDFPLRLAPPSRLVGRDSEVAVLEAALAGAVAGRCGGVLVSGDPGVGKSMLLDELRPLVTRAGGWFVAGKFDQHRQDSTSDALGQALRALARLVLAEPDEEIRSLRSRLRSSLGSKAALAVAAVPELGAILELEPQTSTLDPFTVQGRLLQSGLDILRAIVSPQRPLVMLIDDLQWAGATPLAFVDAVLNADDLPGVLLVGAYRLAEVDAAHPLTAMFARWERLQVAPQRVALANLGVSDLGVLLAEMLLVPETEVVSLAAAIGERTGGNPFDSVELVNALRRDGALTHGDNGWQWDADEVRRHLGTGDVISILQARIDDLPVAARSMLEIVACLGGEVETEMLAVAAGESFDVVHILMPALEDGLLIMDRHDGSIRFRHDRIQQAVLARLDPVSLANLQLKLARHLCTRPDLEARAAGLYLQAVEEIDDPAERLAVVGIFRAAAGQARERAGHVLVEGYLAAASQLAGPDDPGLLLALATDRQAALFNLGRLDKADEVYAWIVAQSPAPLDRALPTWVRIATLNGRHCPEEALRVGLELMRDLGVEVPADPAAMEAAVAAGMPVLYELAAGDAASDLLRPAPEDARTAAVTRTIERLIQAAFFCDHMALTWLLIEGARCWIRYGPSAALVGALPMAGAVISAGVPTDYRTGSAIARRVLTVGEARTYEPSTSQAHFARAFTVAPWFDPLEEVVAETRQALEGLLQAGELNSVGPSYIASVAALVDCAPTLAELLAEVQAAAAVSARIGDDMSLKVYSSYRQFVRSLRGETAVPGEFDDETFEQSAYLASILPTTPVWAVYHIMRALTVAVFSDWEALHEQAAIATASIHLTHATYQSAVARVLRGLSLAELAREAQDAEKEDLLDEFDPIREWLGQRAADAPDNFAHLCDFLDAERAWAVGDFRAALDAFDAARRGAGRQARAWQQGLISERSALFHLAHGLEGTAHLLLVEVAQIYEAWGASAKVARLEREYPGVRFRRPQSSLGASLRSSTSVASTNSIMSGSGIDLIGVLKASQTLSSETSLFRLRERLTEILGSLTGATDVQLVLWSESDQQWFVPVAGASAPGLPLDDAVNQGLLPISAFRYSERTREPLVVDDVSTDARFNRDPFLAGLDTCSLLVIPVLNQGRPQAVLILQNRLSRSMFSLDRLDGVLLIAAQLAVSLDNALLYASLERQVTVRTEALAVANAQLTKLSTTDPLTGLSNRRRLDAVLEVEVKRALVMTQPLSVAMIDVDFFKPYNDFYGHPTGDQCLRRIAAVLDETSRGGDLVARYGGEEFVLVLPGAGYAAAQEVAERIRQAVVDLQQPHTRSPRGVVTISVGVVCAHPTTPIQPQALIDAADRHLYEAKRRGRNQVVAGEMDG